MYVNITKELESYRTRYQLSVCVKQLLFYKLGKKWPMSVGKELGLFIFMDPCVITFSLDQAPTRIKNFHKDLFITSAVIMNAN